jgi:hypothetical protein
VGANQLQSEVKEMHDHVKQVSASTQHCDLLQVQDQQEVSPHKGNAIHWKKIVSLVVAFGLPGLNLHTWTGWGSVTHWNAFVANLEMHGKGRFFDPRLNNAAQFPIAASHGFADLPHIDPDDDLITSKLPALHFINLGFPRRKRRMAALTRPQQTEATSCLKARQDAITVT